MKFDHQALPLTPRQLDIWLAQQSSRSRTEWQLGLFTRIEGTVERDALKWAIRRALQEAEPPRAAFFEANGQVFQRAIDYSDVEPAFYDVSCSRLPVQEANQLASSIQLTPMPFTGPLCKFALFRTRPDEFYWFACCQNIVIDGLSIALVGPRIAAIYSVIVSGAPIPPAFFGSLQDFLDFELEYEASNDYLEDANTHNILRVFGVAVVMATALRCWISFDIRPPLLIHVSKGEPEFARATSEHRKLHRPREARACPVADATSRYIAAGHIGGSRNRPNPAARARVTELCQKSRQELCRNTGPTLLGSSMVWTDTTHVDQMVWRTGEHQSLRRRKWQFFRLGQRRGATQPAADLRRRSSGLAGGLRRSRPRCVSGLHRTELDRYPAEESAREAGRGPGF